MKINSRKNEKRDAYKKAGIRSPCRPIKLNRGEIVTYNSSLRGLCTLRFMN